MKTKKKVRPENRKTKQPMETGSRAGDNSGQKGEEIGTQMSGGAKKWKQENDKVEGYSPLKQSAKEEGKSWRRKESENY